MLWFYLTILDTPEKRDKLTLIYNDYKGIMYYEALRVLKDVQLAEDAVHNSFLALIKIIDEIRTESHNQMASFVVLIVRNKAIDMLRAVKHEKLNDDEDANVLAEMVKDLGVTEDIVITADSMNRLVELISNMDEKYRTPLVLQAKGYKVREIAQILEIGTENVKSRLFRARKMARHLLEGDSEYERDNKG